jgi:cobalt-zinc-cadmium efflux system membrane fusion protein
MKRSTLTITILSSCRVALLASALLISFAAISGEGDHGDEKKDEHRNEFVTMTQEMAAQVGVTTQAVSAGTLNITKTVYGNVVTDPASLSHIRARFDGVVTRVNANLGDKVKKGAALAVVESNESLKSYSLTAPFAGTVIARHANEGELSNGQVLFSLANYDSVWAQLKVFPNQLRSVAEQQAVQLTLADSTFDTVISHILPSPDEQPYVLAYANIDNTSGHWPVGAAVLGNITIDTLDVSMMLPKAAIQEYEGNTVVFVKKGDEYHPEPVMLGKQDADNIQVLSGIAVSDVVVVNNSFLFKADLEKSEAGHDH